MPTPAERRALLFVATVAALGVGVRGCQAAGREPPAIGDRESLARQLAAVDSAIASGGRESARRRAAPGQAGASGSSRRDGAAGAAGAAPEGSAGIAGAGAGLPAPGSIDMDRADAAALDRLPGIGPALAARIVAEREANGPFGSIDGLQRVKGVGPALARRVQPYVTFSLPARPSLTEPSELPVRARRRP